MKARGRVRYPLMMSVTGLTKVPNLKQIVLELLNQIPEGKVTTYKDLAIAIGDDGAARAVGTIMANNSRPDKYPCWRVVHSDGRVGKYSGSGGKAEKIDKIRKAGIPVEEGMIRNFSKFRFQEFQLDPPLSELRRIQGEVPELVSEEKEDEIGQAAGVDVSYGSEGVVASYVEVCPEEGRVLREETLAKDEVRFPYIPGYLAFRELPFLTELLNEVKDEGGLADLVFVDGNGLLHPRKAGLASHLGVALDHPTVGVAKKLLCGSVDETGMELGQPREIRVDGEKLGLAVKTYERANPIYVSIGHKVSLEQAGKLARGYSRYKLPEPIRLAHKAAKREAT